MVPHAEQKDVGVSVECMCERCTKDFVVYGDLGHLGGYTACGVPLHHKYFKQIQLTLMDVCTS